MKSKARGSIRNHSVKSNISRSGIGRGRLIARAMLASLFLAMLLPAPDSIVPNRVLANPGDLVPGFGANGAVFTDFAGGNDSAQAVTANLIGKIIAAGSATIPGRGTDFALACYDRDGNLDPAFGEGGKVTVDFFGANDGARGAVVQPDQKIVLSGFATNGSERQWAFARFNADGSLDPTFDQDGKVVLDLGSTSEAFKVALQSDNKIVAVGDSRPQNSLDFTIVRLNQDGTLDNSFGNNGVVRVDFGNSDRAIDVAIDNGNDGGIFVCGFAVKSQTDSNFGIARLNISDGSLNNAFDGEGKLEVDFFGNQDGAQAMLLRGAYIETEKHLLVGGFATLPILGTTPTQVQSIAPINYQGVLMDSFFVEGQYETRPFRLNDTRDQVFALVDEPDGGFATAGWAGDATSFDLGVARWEYRSATQRWQFSGSYTHDTSSGANNVAFDGMLYEDTIITAGTGFNPAAGNDDFILAKHENEKFVEFTKTVSPDPAVKGDIVTYTLTIKNLTDQTVVLDVVDTLPEHVTFDSDSDPNWTKPPNVFYVVHEPITLGGSETRRITLRVRADSAGVLRNRAYLYTHPFREIVSSAKVESEVTEPAITGAVIQGKKLFLFGSYGNSSGTNQSSPIEPNAIEPQAECPTILIDGEEQKTKLDPDNPSTVLIAKKGGKKIKPGQTVTLKARLCSGAETAPFVFTRPQ
jgi:uncharacterized delta-60 repeat protein/uncharacterized repeat protein (TIGR01451 family)